MEQERVVGDRHHVLTTLLRDARLEPLDVIDRARRDEALEERGSGAIERFAVEGNEHARGRDELGQFHVDTSIGARRSEITASTAVATNAMLRAASSASALVSRFSSAS
jgi:hypothetical protein